MKYSALPILIGNLAAPIDANFEPRKMRRRAMNKIHRSQSKTKAYTEYTPNGGYITTCGRFTVMDSCALDYYHGSSPIAYEWSRIDELCDRERMPFPDKPAYDPLNRPGYPHDDPALWTPAKALEQYGHHPDDADK
jgi:hypothetical protein